MLKFILELLFFFTFNFIDELDEVKKKEKKRKII